MQDSAAESQFLRALLEDARQLDVQRREQVKDAAKNLELRGYLAGRERPVDETAEDVRRSDRFDHHLSLLRETYSLGPFEQSERNRIDRIEVVTTWSNFWGINATRVNADDYLVLSQLGTLSLLTYICRAVFSQWQVAVPETSNKASTPKHEQPSLLVLQRILRVAMWWYRFTGKVEFPSHVWLRTAEWEYSDWMNDYCERFLLHHEAAHIALGHLDAPVSDPLLRETTADVRALLTCGAAEDTTRIGASDIWTAESSGLFVGALTTVFASIDLITQYRYVVQPADHVPSAVRFGRLRQVLAKVWGSALARQAERMFSPTLSSIVKPVLNPLEGDYLTEPFWDAIQAAGPLINVPELATGFDRTGAEYLDGYAWIAGHTVSEHLAAFYRFDSGGVATADQIIPPNSAAQRSDESRGAKLAIDALSPTIRNLVAHRDEGRGVRWIDVLIDVRAALPDSMELSSTFAVAQLLQAEDPLSTLSKLALRR